MRRSGWNRPRSPWRRAPGTYWVMVSAGALVLWAIGAGKRPGLIASVVSLLVALVAGALWNHYYREKR